jgi:hypothetical protein
MSRDPLVQTLLGRLGRVAPSSDQGLMVHMNQGLMVHLLAGRLAYCLRQCGPDLDAPLELLGFYKHALHVCRDCWGRNTARRNWMMSGCPYHVNLRLDATAALRQWSRDHRDEFADSGVDIFTLPRLEPS